MQNIKKQQVFSLTFSGHETFPLRQTWLKKVVDIASDEGLIEKKFFSDTQSLAELGVGKNMLSAIRYWALACGIITDYTPSQFRLTDLAKAIFCDNGFDPYSENPATVWLLHWLFAGKGQKSTTAYVLFNKLNTNKFTKQDLENCLKDLIELKEKKVANKTLENDIDTIIRNYSVNTGKIIDNYEDFTDPIFKELNLIQTIDEKEFIFNRGSKESLSDCLFIYTLLDFWQSCTSQSNSLSLDQIIYEEGSPGRVYKLDENSVVNKLHYIDQFTDNKIVWSDIAGIKQIFKKDANLDPIMDQLLEKIYE